MVAMSVEFTQGPSFAATMHGWWKENSAKNGFFSTLRRFLATLWEFGRESMPTRRRQRYGDAEYDWDHRVDTTSGTVGWRDRLLGLFHSPYQPTEPALFHEIMARLKIDFHEFTFIDIGSGKGRVLLMAADYPFRRIQGIELLPELHRVAEGNIEKYKSDSQRCFKVESYCSDAREFAFPAEPTVLYLFDPLPEADLVEMLANLEQSLGEHPRPVYVLYHNPLLGRVLGAQSGFRQLIATDQYALYDHICLPRIPSPEG